MHGMFECIVFLNQCKVALSGYALKIFYESCIQALNGCIWRVWVTDCISIGANVVIVLHECIEISAGDIMNK